MEEKNKKDNLGVSFFGDGILNTVVRNRLVKRNRFLKRECEDEAPIYSRKFNIYYLNLFGMAIKMF